MNTNANKKEDSAMNDSINNNTYKLQLTKNYELLKEAFKRIDRNSDDLISESELLQFLDSNMANGKKFDRNTFKKIFQLLDVDGNGTITM